MSAGFILFVCVLLVVGTNASAAPDAAANPSAEKPTIAIDAAKTGQPISKYIYGQFIEHLGRCIYGGIWAEVLQDRKFFFAPARRSRRGRSSAAKMP